MPLNLLQIRWGKVYFCINIHVFLVFFLTLKVQLGVISSSIRKK